MVPCFPFTKLWLHLLCRGKIGHMTWNSGCLSEPSLWGGRGVRVFLIEKTARYFPSLLSTHLFQAWLVTHYLLETVHFHTCPRADALLTLPPSFVLLLGTVFTRPKDSRRPWGKRSKLIVIEHLLWARNCPGCFICIIS